MVSLETTSADASVFKLLAVVQLRDPDLAQHGQRTAEIACAIGAEMGCDIEMLDRLYIAGQLHDIGKLGVSEAILWKPAGLTRGEWEIIRTHPEAGYRLVSDVVHREIAAAVLYHHERMDGEGYPYAIDGRTLPLVAKIVQVADAFDAMTSDRPYQPSLPTRSSLAEIHRCAGTQFDADVARATAAVFEDHDEPVLRLEQIHRSALADRAAAETSGPADPFAIPGVVRLRDRPA